MPAPKGLRGFCKQPPPPHPDVCKDHCICASFHEAHVVRQPLHSRLHVTRKKAPPTSYQWPEGLDFPRASERLRPMSFSDPFALIDHRSGVSAIDNNGASESEILSSLTPKSPDVAPCVFTLLIANGREETSRRPVGTSNDSFFLNTEEEIF